MTTESNRHTTTPSPSTQSAELKASDFFPPGTGWNQADKPDEANNQKDTADEPASCDKH